MVKFKLNKQLDKDMASQFLGTSFGGVDFGKSVWENHPELEKLTGKNTEIIDRYFDKFYKQNTKKLENKVEVFQSQWDEVEGAFILETEKLFNDYKFPKGKYIGYVSSFNCNPRFLEDKTFQIFYKSDSSVPVTSHEVMHFIFYAYTIDKFSEITRDLDTNSGLWWDAAEVFNNVILSSGKFMTILKSEGDSGYPNHQELIPKAKELYNSSKSIDIFINELFSLLNK